MDDPAETTTLDEAKRILDLTQRAYMMLKLSEHDSEFDITSNTYPRTIVNYHVTTIQRKYALQEKGLFYLKVGLEENFNDSVDNRKPITGSVIVRFENIGQMEDLQQYIYKNNITHVKSQNDIKPEYVLFYDNYYKFEEIIEGIIQYLA